MKTNWRKEPMEDLAKLDISAEYGLKQEGTQKIRQQKIDLHRTQRKKDRNEVDKSEL